MTSQTDRSLAVRISAYSATQPYAGFAGLPEAQQPSNLPGSRPCPTCRGTGINPVWQTKVCPKCDGERRIRG